MNEWLQAFHFLRPLWLLALPAMLVLIYLWRDQLDGRNPWADVIDPQLLPHLLEGGSDQAVTGTRFQSRLILAVLAAVLLSLALAGPSWRQLPMPVFAAPWHQVLVMDLSVSMNAADLKPSRLQRSKFAAQQLLNQQTEGDTALVAYADSAFAVVPLTPDRGTVRHLLDSLQTDLMPRQGENTAAGIESAMQLLQQTQAQHGNIVLLTDSTPDNQATKAAEAARAAGFRVHVLAAGTAQGAPIPSAAGGEAWLKDAGGGIRLSRLNAEALHALTRAGGGRYSSVEALPAKWLEQGGSAWSEESAVASGDNFKADIWQDEGPWLLLPLIFIAAFAFRRGYLLGMLLCVGMLSPPPAAAGWWKTADQHGYDLLKLGDAKTAADTFSTPDWQASAHYEAGDYQRAAELWSQGDTANAAYNQGNALARSGDLAGALEAYDRALARDPQLSDVSANRKLVEDLLKQQQEQQQGDSEDKNSDEQDQQSQDSDQSGDNSSNEQNQSDSDSDGESDSDEAQEGSKPSDNDEQNPQNSEQADAKPGEKDTADADQEASANEPKDDGEATDEAAALAEDQEGKTSPADEQAQAVQQWLKRIPDDPGRLLREKFKRKQQRREQGAQDASTW